ncbi:hypothetical protein [Agrobacterium sp. P15N1-A]|uniref:hypothetical protein n=1 Tax=Agrobacterium sp. P15N1-A TaxID=3342820 RepID=UPI0037D01991
MIGNRGKLEQERLDLIEVIDNLRRPAHHLIADHGTMMRLSELDDELAHSRDEDFRSVECLAAE